LIELVNKTDLSLSSSVGDFVVFQAQTGEVVETEYGRC
jgi:hypothetical protein